MKTRFVVAAACLFFFSCESKWDGEAQQMFTQSCMEEAATWNISQTKQEAYCNCVLQKAMNKYPALADALEHADSLMIDPDLKGCKKEIFGAE